MAQFLNSSIFDELTKTVQLYFDEAGKKHKQLYGSTVFDKYLDWGVPQTSTTFREVIGRYGVTVAAPIIGQGSMESVLPNEGVDIIQDRLYTYAASVQKSEEDMRAILQLRKDSHLSPAQQTEELIKLMLGDVNRAVESVLARLDMIFLETLFNKGKCLLNSTNSPVGQQGTIDMHQPDTNIVNVTGTGAAWVTGNKDTADCLNDILSLIDNAEGYASFGKILLSPATLSFICRAKKTRELIFGTDKAARPVMLADLNAYMQANNQPIFEPIRRTIPIISGTTVTAFDPMRLGNVVFVPDGKLGKVISAYSIEEEAPLAGVTYSKYNNILVKQFRKGDPDGAPLYEVTKAELIGLPVINQMSSIYTLVTNPA